MKSLIAARLSALNREFYQTFAADFSETRRRLQPGVLRALEGLPLEASILDLGCGNGLLALWLAKHDHQGPYTGLDFSESLVQSARVALSAFPNIDARLEIWDLTGPNLEAALRRAFDRVFAFAVLHHLPSETARLGAFRAIAAALKPSGEAVISNWQFLSSARLRARIVPWERVGLSEADLDPGDYLLDWRRGGVGYRYVHHFTEVEVTELCESARLRIVEHFYSDGKSGDQALYSRINIG